ncbi:NUDIX hydrolase [Patescibacteria group bacterium]|nr:NUDIX hydrolase [Patescibacteria group bacterium]
MNNIPEVKDKELHRIATTVLIYKPDFTYLITRRALHKKMMPGKWTIPGGGLNIDDYIHLPPHSEGAPQWYGALENSMRREIKEEVDLEIGKCEMLTDLTFIRPDGIPVICFSYFTPFISGEVKFDQDTEGDTIDAKWVTLEEASRYDLIDGIWDEIKDVENILKSRK